MSEQTSQMGALAPMREGAVERSLTPVWARTASGIALAFSGYQMWLAMPWMPHLPDLTLRSIHLAFAFVLCFLLLPARAGSPLHRPSIGDFGLAAASIVVFAYIVFNYEWIMRNPATSTPVAIVLGTIVIGLTLEACRRSIGIVFVILVVAAIFYAWFGGAIPGRWGHIGFDWRSIIETLYLSSFGLLGHITGVSADVIAMFLIFGALLARTGGGEAFIDLAKLIAGRSAGGPAKVAVFASALFGTISGSAVANVVVSGVLSIPLMKRMGYRPQFAAAVEATASTGGQMVPPIMGAGAFIMAELLGISYWSIAVAAVIPAFLFYLGCFVCVHLEAVRSDLPRLERSMIPSARELLGWRRSAPLFVPIFVLLVFLARGYTPATAIFWSIALACALHVGLAARLADVPARLRDLVAGFETGGRAIMYVATLIAAAGLIIGAINMTGIGVKLSDFVLGFGGNAVIPSLLLAMVLCIVLGMGLPTTAAYVLAASVVAPAISSLGFEPLAAHLFVFYFAIISAITPPICPAVYVGAALANTSWVTTSFYAMRLGLSGFIVPFMFLFSPELLLIGSWPEVLMTTVAAGAGVVCLSIGVVGQLSRRLGIVSRGIFAAIGIVLVWPGLLFHVAGLALMAIAVAVHLLTGRERPHDRRQDPVAPVPERPSRPASADSRTEESR